MVNTEIRLIVFFAAKDEEAQVEPSSEDLQDFLELTAKNNVLFVIGDWNAKVGR